MGIGMTSTVSVVMLIQSYSLTWHPCAW
jgi:hypothetical protein